MEKFKTTFLSFAFLLLACHVLGQRQYVRSYYSEGEGGQKLLQKMYWALSLPMMNLDLRQRYFLDNAPYDTIINYEQKSSSSFGIGGGFYFNLIKFNKKTSFALDVGLNLMIYQWDVQKARYTGLAIDDAPAKTVMIEMPIGFVYKYGGEVNRDPKHRFLFSAGGGITPTLASTNYAVNNSSGMKFRPFIMMEAGAFFGIDMKLRATYYPVTTEYLNDLSELSYGNGSLRSVAKGSGNFVASFVFFIYSHHWGEED